MAVPERSWPKLVILAGIESAYGAPLIGGAALTGALNAILTTNASLTPLQGQDVNRELDLPNYGHQGVILVNNYASLTFNVEVQGSGEAGRAPAWGTIMRICQMAETLPAANAAPEAKFVTYNPIDQNQESGQIWFNRDGTRHIMLGVRGTWTVNFANAAVPRFAVTLTGLLGTITDEALPVADLTKFIDVDPVTPLRTELRVNGEKTTAESISFDLANQIEPRFLIGDQKIIHSNRMATGQLVVEKRLLAVANWYQRALAHAPSTIRLTHGTTAGKIVQFDVPNAQTGRPTEGETQRIANQTLPLMLKPKLGNDDLMITVK